MSAELKEEFLTQFNLTLPDIIDRVYRKPFPNRFLASLSPFLVQHINEPCVRQLVLNSFKDFLKRNVMQYNYQHNEVHFIGSVAHYYKLLLEEAAKEGDGRTDRYHYSEPNGRIDCISLLIPNYIIRYHHQWQVY